MLSHRRSTTVSLEAYPLYSFFFRIFAYDTDTFFTIESHKELKSILKVLRDQKTICKFQKDKLYADSINKDKSTFEHLQC